MNQLLTFFFLSCSSELPDSPVADKKPKLVSFIEDEAAEDDDKDIVLEYDSSVVSGRSSSETLGSTDTPPLKNYFNNTYISTLKNV